MEKFIDINGITMCYEETGEGKPLILVHGLTGNKDTMAAFPGILGEGRKYIAVDVRGHGKSSKPAAYKLEDHADDIAALIKALGYEKADLLGYSMGSYIALNTGEKYPELIDHLILLASKPNGKTSSVEKIVTDAGYDMATLPPEKMFELILAAALTPESLRKMKSGEMQIDLTALTGVPMTPEEKTAESLSIAGFDLSPDYEKVTCKTLVISCEYDGINPPELGKEIADGIPGAEFVLIKDASHLVPYEQPEALGKAVNEFLAK
ncbi:MAG: alpha/beta hydrolase [Firmicutes bacterium]|nr:alpha/beta hydrolase [Bacillota bacterium]MBQ4372029.1 alpha/beta hydrolase [Bacillota bacterium]